jgi:hypothetical protein
MVIVKMKGLTLMLSPNLTVLKYVNPDKNVGGIKVNNYSSRLHQILALVEICKKDFPDLYKPEENIRIVAYGGDRWKRQTGIEFDLAKDTPIPEDYVVMNLEFLLAGN